MTDQVPGTAAFPVQQSESLVTTLHVTYALHALGLALGAFGASTIVGSFLFGWPSIIAVIINYVKRGEARGTWLESHVNWQIATFWWASGMDLRHRHPGVRPGDCARGLRHLDIGFFALGCWAIYRIARGWMALKERRAMPAVG